MHYIVHGVLYRTQMCVSGFLLCFFASWEAPKLPKMILCFLSPSAGWCLDTPRCETICLCSCPFCVVLMFPGSNSTLLRGAKLSKMNLCFLSPSAGWCLDTPRCETICVCSCPFCPVFGVPRLRFHIVSGCPCSKTLKNDMVFLLAQRWLVFGHSTL